MPSKITELYLDTSVPSLLLATDSPDKKEITERFFKTIDAEPKYKVFTSELVLDEISKTFGSGKEKYPLENG